ncbi:MAG TPA: hypothetical protein VGE01_03510 [Fimbriimonas sp.]
MIHCANCGRPIEKVPAWLEGAKATFVCNNCPNRQAKNIAFVDLSPTPAATARVDDDEDVDVEQVPDEDDADL